MNNKQDLEEQKLDITLQSIGDAVIVTDGKGFITDMNPKAEELTGWSFKEAKGKNIEAVLQLVNTYTRDFVKNPVKQVIASGKTVELADDTLLIAKDGAEYHIADSAAPIKDDKEVILGVVMVFRNITEKFKKEQILKESEEKYRTLVNKSPIGIFRTTSKGEVISINPALVEILGCSSIEEVLEIYSNLGKDLYLNSERRKEFVNLIKKKGEVRNFVYQAKRVDGSHIWLKMDARITYKSDNNFFIIDGFTSDITEQRKAEQALLESEKKYRQLAESAHAILWEYDIINDVWSYVSPQTKKILGYNPEEWANLKFWVDNIHPEDRNWAQKYCAACTAKGEAHTFEYRFLTKEGEVVWLRDEVDVEMKDGKSVKLRGFMIDITERKEAEIKLEKANQKISTSIKKGIKIHQQLLPRELPKVEGLSCASYYQPAASLGGDFYNFIKLDNLLLIYLVDVSGHSLDGAMLSVFIREIINSFLLVIAKKRDKFSPAELIKFIVNLYHQENFPADYLISLMVGVLDIEKNEILFANAGIQIPPIIIDKQGVISHLSCQGLPISSAVEKELYDDLAENRVSFKAGTTIFLTTDGLIEEMVADKNYGEKRLKNILVNNHYLPSKLINYKVKQDFKKFAGSEIGQDDITYLTLKNKPLVLDKFEQTIESSITTMYDLQEEVVGVIKEYHDDYNLLWVGFQELVTNAIEHGNKMDADKIVKIKIEATEKYIGFSVKDQGDGFNWQKRLKQKNDLLKEMQKGKDRGRGIMLADEIYDELYYNKQGNKVFFLKLR